MVRSPQHGRFVPRLACLSLPFHHYLMGKERAGNGNVGVVEVGVGSMKEEYYNSSKRYCNILEDMASWDQTWRHACNLSNTNMAPCLVPTNHVLEGISSTPEGILKSSGRKIKFSFEKILDKNKAPPKRYYVPIGCGEQSTSWEMLCFHCFWRSQSTPMRILCLLKIGTNVSMLLAEQIVSRNRIRVEISAHEFGQVLIH